MCFSGTAISVVFSPGLAGFTLVCHNFVVESLCVFLSFVVSYDCKIRPLVVVHYFYFYIFLVPRPQRRRLT